MKPILSLIALILVTGWLCHSFEQFLSQDRSEAVREVKTDLELMPSPEYWYEVAFEGRR